MKNKDWKLFQPITIRGVALKNRIALLPVGTKFHNALGEVTEKLIDYYEEIAKGGAGLVIVQAAYVTDEYKGSRLRISSDDFVSGLNELAEGFGPGELRQPSRFPPGLSFHGRADD
jgi:2,4-dienoyl-CoA reductase-like NADH-dependent reductase (Old Yellow Enzyme family)